MRSERLITNTEKLSILKNIVKKHAFLKVAYLFGKRVTSPVSARPLRSIIWEYPRFLRELKMFRDSGGVVKTLDMFPCLFDRTSSTRIDSHYFHQAAWVFRKLAATKVEIHVDIGSQSMFIGMLSAMIPTIFVDIRPLKLTIDNYLGVDASILRLPFSDNSLQSLSCLHVIEHIGLGRYGDPIDPHGSVKAAKKIVRVVGPNGSAYVSAPLGRSRVQFNGQRVFAVDEITEMFRGMDLKEFAAVKCDGTFVDMALPNAFAICEDDSGTDFGLGIFWFTKPGHELNNSFS